MAELDWRTLSEAAEAPVVTGAACAVDALAVVLDMLTSVCGRDRPLWSRYHYVEDRLPESTSGAGLLRTRCPRNRVPACDLRKRGPAGYPERPPTVSAGTLQAAGR